MRRKVDREDSDPGARRANDRAPHLHPNGGAIVGRRILVEVRVARDRDQRAADGPCRHDRRRIRVDDLALDELRGDGVACGSRRRDDGFPARPTASSMTSPRSFTPSPSVRMSPTSAGVLRRTVRPYGANPAGSPDSSKVISPSPTRVASSGTVSAWPSSYSPARTTIRFPAFAGVRAASSSAVVVTMIVSGRMGAANASSVRVISALKSFRVVECPLPGRPAHAQPGVRGHDARCRPPPHPVRSESLVLD